MHIKLIHTDVSYDHGNLYEQPLPKKLSTILKKYIRALKWKVNNNSNCIR